MYLKIARDFLGPGCLVVAIFFFLLGNWIDSRMYAIVERYC